MTDDFQYIVWSFIVMSILDALVMLEYTQHDSVTDFVRCIVYIFVVISLARRGGFTQILSRPLISLLDTVLQIVNIAADGLGYVHH